MLLAVKASMYALWHGPAGITAIARRVHASTVALRRGLIDAGVSVVNATYFDNAPLVNTGALTSQVMQAARHAAINLRPMR